LSGGGGSKLLQNYNTAVLPTFQLYPTTQCRRRQLFLDKNNDQLLFNTIAPIYALFYEKQKELYAGIIDGVSEELDLTSYDTILDVGCGTGALCAVLNEMGLSVTSIDIAEKMLDVARSKKENENVRIVQGNILEELPFDDKVFDISFASYVAHGLEQQERKHMYAEMSRVTKHWVVIHDYNQSRSLLISIVEWLEGGDYFGFIKNAESELRNCVSEMEECFSEVRTVDVGTNAAWYICKPT
jgi:SAM-dependent methyltransferase